MKTGTTMSLSDAAEARVRELSAANGGEITPDEIYADAVSKDSPLHEYFEWDKNEAARKYNLQVARKVIASVTIEVEITETMITVPEFVRNPNVSGNEQGYVDITTVAANDELETARKILLSELGRMQAALHRALGYSAFFEKNMLDKLEGIRDQIDVLKEAA